MPRVVAALDRLGPSASAREVTAAVGRAARTAGWSCDEAPVAHGGVGILDALGGVVRRTRARGPLNDATTAEWRMAGSTAVVEIAQVAGLDLVGGRDWNDPMRASTAGVADLIAAAEGAGATRIVVGVGGSATTDGGLGCVRALGPRGLRGVEVLVACDVTTTFVQAAEQFASQKGATPSQVALLARRLERLAQLYEEEHGVDVRELPGSGAAGGLAGGLAALGAKLVPGFELVADSIDLARRIGGADLTVTGECFLDEYSFEGGAVGGVVELCREAGVPALTVVVEAYAEQTVPVIDLAERFGRERALAATVECVEEAMVDHLAGMARLGPTTPSASSADDR
ncbi:MAG TPA: glycerate kinase [Acidimicrobiales bacterium]|nr:glycerate kinase [Acidimicrobiales bacterium]